MTCVWDSLIDAIPPREFRERKIKKVPFHLSKWLKDNNTKELAITVNGVALTEKEKDENRDSISSLRIGKLDWGYLCSTSDPLLILVAHLFKCKIIHNYYGCIITYTCEDPKFTIKIRSDDGHMTCASSRHGCIE